MKGRIVTFLIFLLLITLIMMGCGGIEKAKLSFGFFTLNQAATLSSLKGFNSTTLPVVWRKKSLLILHSTIKYQVGPNNLASLFPVWSRGDSNPGLAKKAINVINNLRHKDNEIHP